VVKEVLVVAMLAAGCGRVGFDTPVAVQDGSALDTADGDVDATSLTCPGGPAVQLQAIGPGYVRTDQMSIPIVHAAGDMLIAGVYFNQTTMAISVSDALGNTWHALTPQIIPSGCDECGASNSQIFYSPTTIGGANTVTVSQQAGVCPLGLFVLSYSGLCDRVLAESGAVATVATDTAIAPALTTSRISVLVGMFTDGHNTGAFVPMAPLGVAANDSGFYAAMLASAPVQPGTYTPTAMLPAPQNDTCWAVAAAAFPQ
jgi:hypothetical protein